MEIQQLRYFVRAAHAASFNEAAESLFISRQALSRSIASLEAELGYALFDRLPVGTKLTPAGARFLAASSGVVSSFDGLERLVRDEHSTLVINLSLPITWRSHFDPGIRRFREANPTVDVRVTSWTDAECLRRLARGEADVIVSHIPPGESLDEGVELCCDPMRIVMGSACPLATRPLVTIDDLVDYDVVYYACGYEDLVWTPHMRARSESYDNDILHIYDRLHHEDHAVFPSPQATIPTWDDGVVSVPYARAPYDVVSMVGYVSLAVRGEPAREAACRQLRDELVTTI